MSLWAIVPVKPLRRAKSRLAGALSEEERAILKLATFENTLRTLRDVPEVETVLVVSPDSSALALARDYGARTLQEDGKQGVNVALHRATLVARAYEASELLLLPSDLPLLTAAEIRRMLSYSGNPPFVVIASDQSKDGTNALYESPVGVISHHLGGGSFPYNLEQAARRSVHVEVFESPLFALDLDRPEDLAAYRQIDSVRAANEPPAVAAIP